MSSSTEDPISQIDLGNTFGALFIGAILAAVLFGLSNVQVFLYFQTHGSTGITFHKLVVIWLWIFDALHLALIIHSIYYYLVINYANISALTEIVWSFKLQIVIDVILIYGAHVMYAYRIWIVSKGRSRTLPTIVCVIVVLVSGPGIAAAWSIYQCHVFTDLLRIEWATFMALGTITCVDLIVASSLCYLLAASRTGFSNTDSFITKLMAYTINTGCLTSLFSLTTMITCAVMPRNFVFLGLEFLVTKLYVNSFLALLNAPYYLQAGANTTNSSEFHMRPRPELHIKTSQDGELQASRKNMFRFFGDEVVHSTRSVKPQQPIEVAVEMDSFSSA
ncbi:uncharacterized protein EDB91DRAFT_1242531 [Suillus paluster]|uniref:uncharacterized protein n=1 Tax=Suillus paluster TaxID=48578 RepID=UPI001B87E1B3|nr:uncharacterized protein EDB91DRAFT_1242531 [Suillus paluster]KAG1753548.1 hypothetical protein EDB91DRAFT_1242531 [Suillus paluster]